ncbi:MAG: 50S ribosomal protein L11 [Gemmataceae bacterium]
MAKQVTGQIKLQVPCGAATPAPPVGPALGQHGVNIGAFVKQFNDGTAEMEKGMMVPVVITVFNDRSFEFIVKKPPAAILIKKAAGIPTEKKKGGELIPASHKKAGKYNGFTLTREQVLQIAEMKFTDLNARDIEHASRIIAGTARSMGISVEEA